MRKQSRKKKFKKKNSEFRIQNAHNRKEKRRRKLLKKGKKKEV
jgi:hypothetical protein